MPALLYRKKDDGVGFDMTNKINTGNGLINMQRSAALINAKLHIESQPEKGTTLTLMIDKGN